MAIPAWVVSLLGLIIPKLILMFYSDLAVRQQKLNQFEAWQKLAVSKGETIADEVEQGQQMRDELAKKTDA